MYVYMNELLRPKQVRGKTLGNSTEPRRRLRSAWQRAAQRAPPCADRLTPATAVANGERAVIINIFLRGGLQKKISGEPKIGNRFRSQSGTGIRSQFGTGIRSGEFEFRCFFKKKNMVSDRLILKGLS